MIIKCTNNTTKKLYILFETPKLKKTLDYAM